MPIGDNIKRIRQLKKVSVATLAQKTDIKPESIYAWERGDYNPSEENLKKVADALLVSVKEFYEENPTSVQNRSDNSEIPKGDNLNEILEKVESSRDYFVIPRAVLKENYRLVALEQFQIEKEKLENERDEMKRRAEKDRVYLEAQLEANRDLSRKLDVLLAKFAEVQKSQ